MTNLNKIIALLFLVTGLTSLSFKSQASDTISLISKDDIVEVIEPHILYGEIGAYEGNSIDNPEDNIFKFNMTKEIGENEELWVEYELRGIESNSSLGFIVNDNVAMGGSIIKQSDTWNKVSHRISKDWIHSGVNRIQFSKIKDFHFGFGIQHPKLIVKKAKKKSLLYIYPSSQTSYDSYISVQGFTAVKDEVKEIKINGQSIVFSKNIIDYILKVDERDQEYQIDITLTSGEVLSEIVPVTTKVDNIDFLHKSAFFGYSHFNLSANEKFEYTDAKLKISIEDSVLMNDMILSVEKLRYVDLPPSNLNIENVTADAHGVRLLPHGTHFTDNGATIRIPFTKENLPAGSSAQDIYTFYFDINTSEWVKLERDSIDYNENVIVSKVTHFTDYINGVIITPESSESTNYTSNYFNDMLVQSPTSNMVLIQPPSPNSSGDANINFPIHLPKGRNGMQPSLALNYSSEGGSSWVGYGWSLEVPSITIETRWGAPRYDVNSETEAYLLNGQQILLDQGGGNYYVPHARDAYIQRQTGDATFKKRKESPSGFERIIRSGNGPSDYIWTITDRHGTIYTYDTFISTAVGNRARWYVTTVTDTYGNSMTYNYDTHAINNATGASVADMDVWCYLQSIEYTMPGPAFTVTFNTSDNRADPRIDGRTGVLYNDHKRLNQIIVSCTAGTTTGPVRTYELNYVPGKFNKTLLNYVEVLDAGGAPFYTHTFGYHDDLQTGISSFTQNENWDTGDPGDIVDGTLMPFPDGGDDEEFSPLGGGQSSALGGSLYVGVGIPLGVGKQGTVGGHFGYTRSNSEGKVQFLDIDGDGLPDKVYDNGSELSYRPNRCRSIDQLDLGQVADMNFDNELSVGTNLVLSATEDDSYDYGIRGNFPFGNVGASQSKSTSKTHSYLNDINGDGFVDFVQNGSTLFNMLDPTDPNSTIGFGNPATCSLVNPTGLDVLYQVSQTEQDDYNNEHPRLDVVKAWEAPFTGAVTISQTNIQNMASASAITGTPDGVFAYIQHEANPPLWSGMVPVGGMATQPVRMLTVMEGDIIYFRTSSGDNVNANGESDEVEWDININYNDPVSNVPSVYNENYGTYNFANDALTMQMGSYTADSDGNVTIQAEVNIINAISDEVRFEVWVNGLPIAPATNCGTSGTTPINQTVTLVAGDNVQFVLSSNSNIDWNNIEVDNRNLDATGIGLDPFLGDDVFVNYQFTEEIDAPIPIDYPTSRQSVLNGLVQTSPITDPYTIILGTIGNTIPTTQNETFIVSIKDDDMTYYQQLYTYTADAVGVVTLDPSPVEIINQSIPQNAIIYATVQYSIDDISAGFIENIGLSLVSNTSIIQRLAPTHYALDMTDRVIYNSGYRGWSIFAYNPDAGGIITMENVIDVAQLNFTAYENDAANVNTNPAFDPEMDFTGPSLVENVVFPMACQPSTGTWIVGDGITASATRTSQTPSRLLDDDPVLSGGVVGGGATGNYPGITMQSESSGEAFSAGAAVGVGDVSLTISSSGSTENTVEYMDLNGDRIPDVIGNTTLIGYSRHNGNIDLMPKINFNTTGTSNNLIWDPLNIGFGANIVHSFSSKGSVQGGKNSMSCGLNLNYSNNVSRSDVFWLDVNGDGLPDQVITLEDPLTGVDIYQVKYNLGYSLTTPIPFVIPAEPNQNMSETGGIGGGLSLFSGSVSGGVGYSRTNADGKTMYIDVNGDGLPDFLDASMGPIQLYLNTGNGYTTMAYTDYDLSALGNNTSRTQMIGSSANIAFTIAIDLLVVRLAITPGVNTAESINKVNATFQDIDGDGFVDFLTSTAPTSLLGLSPTYADSDQLRVNRSLIRRTNKLSSVTNSIGGNFTLDYNISPATIQHPSGKFVMSEVTVDDGNNDNGPVSANTFEYSGGYYDRCERTFLGFDQVIINELDPAAAPASTYRVTTSQYTNATVHDQGFNTQTQITDAVGAPWKTVSNNQFLNPILPTPVDMETPVFSGVTDTRTVLDIHGTVGEHMDFLYDNYGNVTRYRYTNSSSDLAINVDYTTTIGYFQNLGLNILGVANSMEIPGLRSKSALIYPEGKIQELTVETNAGSPVGDAVTSYTYDGYGNLASMTLPNSGGRLAYTYTYEPDANTYVNTITNSFMHTTTLNNIDIRFGTPGQVIDINGFATGMVYDNAGRLRSFTSPKIGEGATFMYNSNTMDAQNAPIYSHTARSDPDNGTVSSGVFADGFGRTIRTAKNYTVNGTDTNVFSGIAVYDAFGRVVNEHYPSTAMSLNYNSVNGAATTHIYDILDRKTDMSLPGGRDFAYSYAGDGMRYITTTVVDANTNRTSSSAEYNGQVWQTISAEQNLTNFDYDAIDQMTSYTRNGSDITSFTYDLAGRTMIRTSNERSDVWNYDPLGNVTAEINNWQVDHVYDRGRLTNTSFSDYPWMNVTYMYDEPINNSMGRVWRRKDGSGAIEYIYDEVGNVEQEKRAISIPFTADEPTFTTDYEYDTWGRVRNITYPDGEFIEYTYDFGGNPVTLNGLKSGIGYSYVGGINYDEFGARTSLQYGNGVITTTTYDAATRWMNFSESNFTGGFNFIIDNIGYDNMGNLEEKSYNMSEVSDEDLECSDLPLTTGGMFKYDYDMDYRITSSSGEWKGTPFKYKPNCPDCLAERVATYSTSYGYDRAGNMESKNHSLNRRDEMYPFGFEQNKSLNLTYQTNQISGVNEDFDETEKPYNSIDRKAEQRYSHDGNGNIVSINNRFKDNNNGGKDHNDVATTQMLWQARDLLRAHGHGKAATHFFYDGAGERVIKATEPYHKIWTNSDFSMDPKIRLFYTLYPNAYIVYRPDGHYTKHYFIGSDRVCSKVGNSKDYRGDLSGNPPLGHIVRGDMEQLIDNNLSEIEFDWKFLRAESQGLGLSDVNDDEELNRFFFTKDQVGSSSYVSDAAGEPHQFIGYMPFGGTYTDIRTEIKATNYRFTGKEQDMETGLYYYGARYYDPNIGRFMSVDPLADQFAGWSPYNYTLNNPIKFIDPDGRAPVSSNGGPGDPKNFTVSIGIHSRGSALVTSSINFGIMIDNQGTFATYKENTLGGGLIAGLSSAVNVGVHDGDVMAQKGKGWNMGFDAIVFGGELNMRDIKGYPGHEFLDVFKGGNIDTPAGFGLSAGIYFERSDVDFLSGGTLDYFFENSNTIFDQMGVPEDKRAEFMQHIQQVNNAINENNCQDECIEK